MNSTNFKELIFNYRKQIGISGATNIKICFQYILSPKVHLNFNRVRLKIFRPNTGYPGRLTEMQGSWRWGHSTNLLISIINIMIYLRSLTTYENVVMVVKYKYKQSNTYSYYLHYNYENLHLNHFLFNNK